MGLENDVETLFGYERSESLAPLDLMQSILDQIYQGTTAVGLVAIGSEGAVLKAKRKNYEYAIKIAHPRFLRAQEHVKIFSVFKYEKETQNSFRARFVNGCEVHRYLEQQIEHEKPGYFAVPKVVEILEKPILLVLMEFVHGINLLRYIAERKNLKESLALYRQMLECVRFFHRCGVLHRDIKPDNILITGSGGRPKLCFVDWTLSRFKDVSKNTIPGVHMGTLPYAAPKLIMEGNAQLANESDDVYGCGIMLYEFLHFKKAPRPKNYADLCTSKAAREQYIRQLAAGIPAIFQQVFTRATAEDEKSRYNKIDPMIFDLDKILQQEDYLEQIAIDAMDLPQIRKMVLDHAQILRALENIGNENKADALAAILKDHKIAKIAVPLYRAILATVRKGKS